MRLTIIGCSGSMPGPESAASCYLVEAPYAGRTFRLVLDLGSGALGTLQRFVALDTVDAVALSHLHADHCLDLCGYYVFRKYHPGGPLPHVTVYGPEGTAQRMARAYDLPDEPGMSDVFSFVPYADSTMEIGPFSVDVARVHHPVPAYAVRVSHDGRSLVYTGDTGPCSSLDDLAKGCDLLLAESSFVEGGRHNPMDMHLTGRQAALTAERAGVGQLVLTHIPPWHDREVVRSEAVPHFAGPVSLAVTGASYDL
ncbi:MAG TPA: MBL fold metallo-hydrolase [Nocardioidaceae bacterium]